MSSNIVVSEVKVIQVDENAGQYKISWDFIPGVTSYKVYGSPTPMTKNYLDTVNNQNYYIFNEPIWTPEDVVYYFWVSYIGYGNIEKFINDFPASYYFNVDRFAEDPFSQESNSYNLITNTGMKYYFEEIRRRHQSILENDGEDFYLYIRKWSGKPCKCTKMGNAIVDDTDAGLVNRKTAIDNSMAQDPDYQGSFRCPDCFGVGIYGGYYPKIKIRIRYGNIPTRGVNFTNQGIQFTHDFDSWTLWHPKLHKYDVLHRILDGDRFLVDEIGQSEMRGTPFRQQFRTICKPKTDPIYQINDDKIWEAITNGESDPNPYFKVWM